MRVLVRNGTVVTAEGARPADVLIADERIVAVAPGIGAAADTVYDASGRYVIPGGVDVHTHLDMPYGDATSADDFATGTVAAACGGTTTIVDFAVQSRGDSLHDALAAWQGRARDRAAVDYGFHMIVCDLPERREPELDELVAEGVPSFKLFTAYPDRLMVDDATIFRTLLRTAANGGTVMVHAENGGVIEVLQRRALAAGRIAPIEHARTRPPLAEAEATYRCITLAAMANAPLYVVHVSAAETVDVIAAARARGLPVFGETCPQYLLLTEAAYAHDGERFVMSPPLRDERAQERLWRGLATDELQVVATDHCPFRLADKRGRADFTKIPGGAPGIETRLSLLFDGARAGGRFGLERFVTVTATAPAQLFGLYPQKGTIAPGSDADLVIWDPDRTVALDAAALHMRVDYSPYEGRVVRGGPDVVLLRGRPLVERGAFVGQPGGGRFLRRRARSG